MANQGFTFGVLDRPGEAVAAYQQVIDDYRDDPNPALREPVVRAIYNHGVVLGQLGRPEEAIDLTGEELISRLGEEPADTLEVVAELCLKHARSLLEGPPRPLPVGVLVLSADAGFNVASASATSLWATLTQRAAIPRADTIADFATRLTPEGIRQRRRRSEEALAVSEAVIARLAEDPSQKLAALAARAHFLAASAEFRLGRTGPLGRVGPVRARHPILAHMRGGDPITASAFERFADEEAAKPGLLGQFSQAAFLGQRARALVGEDPEQARMVYDESIDARLTEPRGRLVRLFVRMFRP